MRQYRVHEFVLNSEARSLLGPDGVAIELSPRLFDALLFMVENAGQLLDKDRLLAALWPGLVVEENSLSQCISGLRKALSDDAQRPRFIQTVPRRGFRFIAPVVSAGDAAGDGSTVDLSHAAGNVGVPAPDVFTDPGPARATAPASHSELDSDTRAESAAPTPAPAVAVAVAGAGAAPPAQMATDRRRRLVLAGSSIGLLALGAAGTWAWQQRPALAAAGAVNTLAILPFKPIAADRRDELLEVGMAESLVARLSNLPGVAVRSVGSVRRFAGADQDPISAARELNVIWIIDGSVQRADGRVRVTARLLNTASGEAAWSGRFDETPTGVFDLQDAISEKVAGVLAPHLQRRGRERLAGAGGTRLVDAYQLYLTARQHAQSIRNDGLVRSVALYRRAVALDPAYALAWSGMGESYRRMVFGADGEPAVVLREVARCQERAVQLDPDLAEGHAGMGWVRFWRDWDWPTAAASFERALELNVGEANAHLGYSLLLTALGRSTEALEHLRQARESDPLSLILLTIESSHLAAAGRRAQAAERLQRVFDIEPDFWVAHMVQASLQLAEGRAAEAISSLERADQLSDGSSQAAASLGHLLARQGQTARALTLLKRLEVASTKQYVPPTSIGLIHAGLGDKAAAMAALERGVAVRDVRMTLVGRDGRWGLLHDDARFANVLRQMKLA